MTHPVLATARAFGAVCLGFALFAAGCATGPFEPDRWSPDDYVTWLSHPGATAIGKVFVRTASPPAEDDPRTAYRFETEDGRVLTRWMQRPVPVDQNGSPRGYAVTRTGTVAVFDDGEPLIDDRGAPPPAGWYVATPDGLRLLPLFGLWVLHGGSMLGVTAEWEGDAPDLGGAWERAVGQRQPAPKGCRSLALVALDDDLRVVGEPLPLDPTASEPWGVLGSNVRLPGPKGTSRYFDAKLQPFTPRCGVEVQFQGLRILLVLTADGALCSFDSAGVEHRIEGHWDTLRELEGLGRKAVALGRAGTAAFDLLLFRDLSEYVAIRDVLDVEPFAREVPAVLRGKPGFGATWHGLLAHRLAGGVEVFETYALEQVTEGAGSPAPDRNAALAAVDQMLTGKAAELQAAIDVRLARAYRPLEAAGELTKAYIDALQAHDFGAAGFAAKNLRAVLNAVEIPGDLPQAEDVRRRISLEWITVIDWELRRPDRTLESLVAVMASASMNAGFASRYWKLLDDTILAYQATPTRAVWDDLYKYASNSVGEDARKKILWWHDRISQQETRAQYDAAMARGDYEYADSISSGLGEDGWIQHLLTAPVVGMRADLLAIAMQRRPDLVKQIQPKLRQVIDEELAARRRTFAAQQAASDAASAASAAAWQASTRRWEKIQELAAKGVSTWGQ